MADGYGDMVRMVQDILADPELPNKAREEISRFITGQIIQMAGFFKPAK
jgi:2,4-dienoyl-CoA reductase-like NADH-dependent reductase (Old Yellow Enzyme family)